MFQLAETPVVAGAAPVISNGAIIAAALVAIIIGAVYCFFGYRIFKVTVSLIGGIILGATAGMVAYQFTKGNTTTSAIAAAVGGLVGLIIAYKLYKVGVFLLGAMFGFTLGMFALSVAIGPQSAVWVCLISAFCAVGIGFLSLRWQRMLVVTATAFVGASWILLGAMAIIAGGDDMQKKLIAVQLSPYWPIVTWLSNPMYLGIMVLVGLIGAALQVSKTAKKKLAEDKAKEAGDKVKTIKKDEKKK
jgi:MFS family permease